MNSTGVRRAVASAGVLALAGLGLLAAPVAAQAVGGNTAAASADGNLHCVAHASGPLETKCYGSFAEALEKATGGRLVNGPKNAAAAMADAGFSTRLDAANDAANQVSAAAGYDTVISIEYTSSGWGGSDLIWLGTGNCSTSTGNTDFYASSMPAGFVNTITSFRTYANCWAKHYEDPGFGGASVGYEGTRSQISAALDNRTSSQRWS